MINISLSIVSVKLLIPPINLYSIFFMNENEI
jgi:hypothetical protein